MLGWSVPAVLFDLGHDSLEGVAGGSATYRDGRLTRLALFGSAAERPGTMVVRRERTAYLPSLDNWRMPSQVKRASLAGENPPPYGR